MKAGHVHLQFNYEYADEHAKNSPLSVISSDFLYEAYPLVFEVENSVLTYREMVSSLSNYWDFGD